MLEFYTDFRNVLTELLNMQLDDTPLVLLSVLSQVLRFGLLALCILSAVLFIQLIITIFNKNSRGKNFKNPIFIALTLIVTAGISIFAFLPISVAPKHTATSAAFQDILFTEEVYAQQDDVQDITAPQGENAEEEAENITSAEGKNDDENEKENAKSFVISSHAELEPQYTQQITELLLDTQCTRTLKRNLPEEDGQNILFRLENGDVWQIRLNAQGGYAFKEENVDFIYEINDYEEFHVSLSQILQA